MYVGFNKYQFCFEVHVEVSDSVAPLGTWDHGTMTLTILEALIVGKVVLGRLAFALEGQRSKSGSGHAAGTAMTWQLAKMFPKRVLLLRSLIQDTI